MTDTTKLADLPAAWRRTAKSAGIPVAATFNACADELEAALAARQPVGQEPVCSISPYDLAKLQKHETARVRPPGQGVPLYAAPPAQVDLEQFRDAVVTARAVHQQDADNWRGRKREAIYLEYVAECDRLLALIDQQAGKGVERG